MRIAGVAAPPPLRIIIPRIEIIVQAYGGLGSTAVQRAIHLAVFRREDERCPRSPQ